ncbi:hypothetical protein P43SY_010693 [Pythium insidiosum]|uniref:Reverse transcriptase n=1 Tax=Pythium insidiosum TaxID=114742 RepID=A0AAD5L758_PYTIN|nr:hypothetical protein P43SY_010693 [Pythium insidiosum]
MRIDVADVSTPPETQGRASSNQASATETESENEGEEGKTVITGVVMSSIGPQPATPRSLGFDARKLGLNEYDPEKDGIVDTWLASVENAVRADEVLVGGKWPTAALYYVVGSKLRGSAATFFASMEAIATSADRTYDSLAARLRQQYGTKLTEAAAVNKLMQRKKQAGETYQEYAMALRQAAEGVPVGEQFFIEAFQDGLGDFTGSLVRNKAPATLMDAVHCATLARGNDGRGVERTSWQRGRGARAPEVAPINLVQVADDEYQGPSDAQDVGPAPATKTMVPWPKQQPSGVPAAGGKRKWQSQQGSGYSHYGPAANRRQYGVKVDTCAAYSVAGTRMKEYGERLPQTPPVDFVQGLGGQQLRVEGLWRFALRTIYNQLVKLDALLVEGCDEEILLGKDFLVEKKARIDFETNEARYAEDEVEIILPFSVSTAVGPAAVRLVRGRTVQTETFVTLRVPVSAPEGTVGIFEPTAQRQGWLMAPRTVTLVQQGHVTVPVLSVLGKTTKLPARRQLGVWVPLNKNMEVLEERGDLTRGRVKQWIARLREGTSMPLPNESDLQLEHLGKGDAELVRQVLRAFPGVVSEATVCPPLTKTGVEHHIPTGTAAPILHRAWRKSVAENAIVDEHVQKMLREGVIEMGNGPWGFPVVLVRKKDGTVRFCVDYRALNQITVKDVYPLPRIDETLESLGGACRFTTLDLLAGYWQIAVAEQDRDKTAFVTRQGLFRFTRMPFGLSNAPGTFQRLMDCVLRGLLWVCCLVYLDDIVVFTKGSMERHVVELATVLARLEDHGLSIKAKKCTFAATRLEYLGHELTPEGVRPLSRLTDAVEAYPEPTDATSVKRFVHLAGYYRRFIENFGTKMAPLTRLLRKDAMWEWGEAQRHAFANVKRELSAKPLLCYPDFEKPFVLATDASKVGLGAALQQDQGRGLQPIGYASKTNSTAQANYTITELECLAVVWAVEHFRPYLYGRRFTVVTDHNALKWLMTAKDLKNRLQRWALTLAEYDIDVVYRPGRENVVPDALSRAPVNMVVSTAAAATRGDAGYTEARQLDEETVRRHQSESEMCHTATLRGTLSGKKVEKREGKLMVLTEGGWRTLLPPSLWAQALRGCHDSIWAGHLRGPQTLARVQRAFWWPRVRRITLDWVSSCRDCGSRKVRPAKVVPPLRNLKVGAVGDRWALDFAGPLPVTANGNRYVIAIVEYATKWVVAVPTPTREAATVARVLMERVVFQYGPFRELLTDGAAELQSETVNQLVIMLQAKQTTPVAYRPNLMGLVERFNRTWKDMVAIYVGEHQSDWDEWLPALTHAYNTAKHTATEHTPYQLMFGREPRLPRDLLLRERLNEGAEPAQWIATDLAHEVWQEEREPPREERAGGAGERGEVDARAQQEQGNADSRMCSGPAASTLGDVAAVTTDGSAISATEVLAPTSEGEVVGVRRESEHADQTEPSVLVEDEDSHALVEVTAEDVSVHQGAAGASARPDDGTAAATEADNPEGPRTRRRVAEPRRARTPLPLLMSLRSRAPAILTARPGVERARRDDYEDEQTRAFLRLTRGRVFFVERRRRRRRNRIGQYVMEIEVEVLTGPSAGQSKSGE